MKTSLPHFLVKNQPETKIMIQSPSLQQHRSSISGTRKQEAQTALPSLEHRGMSGRELMLSCKAQVESRSPATDSSVGQAACQLHNGAQQLLDRLLVFSLGQLTGEWASTSCPSLPLLALHFPDATPACCLPPEVIACLKALLTPALSGGTSRFLKSILQQPTTLRDSHALPLSACHLCQAWSVQAFTT